MSSTTPLTDAINALTTYANEVTGKNDTTLSDAVGSLVDGYGGSGNGSLDDYIDGTTIEIISNVNVVRTNGITASGNNITSIILPECTELKDGAIRYGGYTNNSKFFTALSHLELPKVQKLGTMSLCGISSPSSLNAIVLPSLVQLTWRASNGRAFERNTAIKKYDFGSSALSPISIGSAVNWYGTNDVITDLIFRYNGVVSINTIDVFRYDNTHYFSFGTTCFIYVPQAQLENYKTATNWSTLYSSYPDMFKTIEGSIYETQYADGTPISTT